MAEQRRRTGPRWRAVWVLAGVGGLLELVAGVYDLVVASPSDWGRGVAPTAVGLVVIGYLVVEVFRSRRRR